MVRAEVLEAAAENSSDDGLGKSGADVRNDPVEGGGVPQQLVDAQVGTRSNQRRISVDTQREVISRSAAEEGQPVYIWNISCKEALLLTHC